MSENKLVVKGNYDIGAPSQMVAMAKILKTHIVEKKLYTEISGKNYAHVEGWQFAGGIMGIYPKVTEVQNLSTPGKEFKWRADVELVRMKDEKVVGYGAALCSNLESKKKTFDEYAVMSMAQTRAIGKAYRNLIGWVMKLAGYEATPTEEMFKMGDIPTAAPVATKIATPVKGELLRECFGCGNVISEAEYGYSKKLYGKPFCRTHQKTAKRK